MKKIRILIIGCGNMGSLHAKAYDKLDEFEISGLVSRKQSKQKLQESLAGDYPLYDDYITALEESSSDAVCISTYPDTHEEIALKALEHSCHVFLEKPIATSVEATLRVINKAKECNKKLVVGYILRHHPSWQEFILQAKKLGSPLVMRMNLNQQSRGKTWDVHRNLMNSLSPIVDCGVHYVDVMCQMTRSKPVSVAAIGARLSEQIDENMYNYGNLQVKFEDGSVGWYEAGWGPMASTKAFFIKDVWGPKGSVTITAENASQDNQSDNVDSHVRTEKILIHKAELDENNEFMHEDEWLNTEDEPDHNELCLREQQYFLKAIVEDLDLTLHLDDALNSFKIVIAADKSIRENKTILL